MCSSHIIPNLLFMEILHIIFLSILIISYFFVFFSENTVHSVLYLILAFCSASGILILIKAEFLALLFLIIYVGAIAVLFLFVIMMLNVKKIRSSVFFYIIFFISLFVLIPFYNVLAESFGGFSIDSSSFFNAFDIKGNISNFGQILYNYYLICFLLAGILLLVAMVGAIILTLNFKNDNHPELSFRQLSRSKNIIFFNGIKNLK